MHAFRRCVFSGSNILNIGPIFFKINIGDIFMRHFPDKIAETSASFVFIK